MLLLDKFCGGLTFDNFGITKEAAHNQDKRPHNHRNPKKEQPEGVYRLQCSLSVLSQTDLTAAPCREPVPPNQLMDPTPCVPRDLAANSAGPGAPADQSTCCGVPRFCFAICPCLFFICIAESPEKQLWPDFGTRLCRHRGGGGSAHLLRQVRALQDHLTPSC